MEGKTNFPSLYFTWISNFWSEIFSFTWKNVLEKPIDSLTHSISILYFCPCHSKREIFHWNVTHYTENTKRSFQYQSPLERVDEWMNYLLKFFVIEPCKFEQLARSFLFSPEMLMKFVVYVYGSKFKNRHCIFWSSSISSLYWASRHSTNCFSIVLIFFDVDWTRSKQSKQYLDYENVTPSLTPLIFLSYN